LKSRKSHIVSWPELHDSATYRLNKSRVPGGGEAMLTRT
jgi:hypothetical protein